jgi:ADP-ribosyl-[dinitrogen reductase] hydrolase
MKLRAAEWDTRCGSAGRVRPMGETGIEAMMGESQGEVQGAGSNRQVLNHLFTENQITLRRGAIFDVEPPPMPAGLDFGRVEGMMLGLAIGDALGNTTESQSPHQRKARHGEIRDYLPNRYAGDRAVGLPSDDTQLAFWTLAQMIEDGRFIPEHVADRFCRSQIFGIGSAVRQFVDQYRQSTHPWYRCGARSAGNGALMRMAPMVIPHLRSGTVDLWVDTALSAMITHNDSASTTACLSFVNMLWHLLQMDAPPPPGWWVEAYVQVARDLEVDETYRPRGGQFPDYEGPLWRFVDERVREAYDRALSALEACNSWYSGAYLLETMPCVVYILMLYAHDPEEAIVRAVNDTRDNDTIAAIVGAAVGALHGQAALPERWIGNLLGRTAEHDDGHVFRLLAEAKRL